MSSLFDHCPNHSKKNTCGKCLCKKLKDECEGSKFFILIDGFPEFIEATFIRFKDHSCCAKFVVSNLVSPISVFPNGIGSNFTLYVDCRDLKALVPLKPR